MQSLLMFHAGRDTGACRPTSCLKMSGQTVLWRRHATEAMAAALRFALSEWMDGTPRRTAAAAAHRDRFAGMPRLAQRSLPSGGSMPCPAAHASHGGGASSTEQAELNYYDPTCLYDDVECLL